MPKRGLCNVPSPLGLARSPPGRRHLHLGRRFVVQVERRAEILSGPVDRPWGQRTLHVADPDGNVVEFAKELEK